MKVNLGNAEGSRPWYTRAHHHVQQEVGRRIRELRGFDMTREEFAERIGMSQNYLSTMEHGKVEIGAEILLRITSEFGKSVEWLLMGEK
jgi:transcriptional regulator with XRE-family HTH domain